MSAVWIADLATERPHWVGIARRRVRDDLMLGLTFLGYAAVLAIFHWLETKVNRDMAAPSSLQDC